MLDFSKLKDPDTEAVLLGTMLASKDAVDYTIGEMEEGDFYNPDHVVIFRAMKKLYQANHVIDPFSVINQISEFRKNFNDMYVVELRSFASHGNGSYQVEKLKELSLMRKLMSVTCENFDLLKEKKGTSEEVAAKIIKETETVMDAKGQESKTYRDVMIDNFLETGEPYWKYLQKRMEMARDGLNVLGGVPTYYPRLDEALNGLNAGHLIVIGARPGVGKTTFILNIMRNLAYIAKIPVAFFSLEMSDDQVFTNITFIHKELYSKNFRTKVPSNEEFNACMKAVEELQDMPLHVDSSPALKISQLAARAKRYVAVNGVKAIFIDYLTLISPDIKYQNREEGISSISKSLRALAKELKVPIVCLAQLNRSSESENRAPKKSDLRESGQIEQDAHSIILLSEVIRDGESEEYRKKYGHVRAEIAKNRFGSTQDIYYEFYKESGLMKEDPPIKYFHPRDDNRESFSDFDAP
jgi:replicative DNA helicase